MRLMAINIHYPRALLALLAAAVVATGLLALVGAKPAWAADPSFVPAPNSPFQVGSALTTVTNADFNGDGKQDLAAQNFGTDNVSVLLGNGDGTFKAKQDFAVGTNPTSVTSADFDGDGDADLAVSNSASNNVSVLLGNGDGTFGAAQNFPADDLPAFVISPDLDADSFADLAVANQDSNNISVLLNTVSSPPPPPPIITSPPNNTIDTNGNFTVSGTAEANSTVELFEGLTSKGTATVNASGEWSKSLTGVADGLHTYTAKARDAAGSMSGPSSPLTVDVRIPPLVVNVSPADQAPNVPVNTNVVATFSEAMNKDSVEALGTFTLKLGASPVAATVSYDPTTKKATLGPNSSLAWNATYTVTIKGGASGAKDVAGNALETDKVWTFSTVNDATAPSTTHTLSPLPNANDWNKENVTVTLSAQDNQVGSGVKEITFSINGGANQTYNSTNKIPVNIEGTTTISYIATDNAGNPESPAHTFEVKLDKSAPAVDSFAPVGKGPTGTGWGRGTNIMATFSEEMDESTLTTQTIKLINTATGRRVNNVVVSYNEETKTVMLDPFGPTSTTQLAKNTKYKVTVTTGAKNLAGISLDQNPSALGNQPKSWTFTTASS